MLIDGLQCGNFTPEILAELRAGGAHCVTVTCGFWETAIDTMDMLGAWNEMALDHPDLMLIARSASDVERARASGRIAVLLGAQNSDLLDSRLAFVELFTAMGLRSMQLTYNTQNSLGSGCYESNDPGLTRFGKEVVREMNRVGMLVDLSHVGPVSSMDAIRASTRPVAITHANALSLFEHRRNKSDDLLHALRDNGGVMGCAIYRNITGDANLTSARAWGEMVARTVEIAGIDHVAIGTDKSHNMTRRDHLWMRKGRWSRTDGISAGKLTEFGSVPPVFFQNARDIGNLVTGLREAGFSEGEVAKISYGNWMRVYAEVFDGVACDAVKVA